MLRSLPFACAVLLLGLAACGAEPAQSAEGPAKAPVATPPPTTNGGAAGASGASGASAATTSGGASSGGAKRAERPDAAAIFERIKTDLVGCYETGRKSTPTMLDGKLTLNAAVEANGKATCVIPTEDTGLTQEVEDCMSARLARETFGAADAPWSAVVPIAVRSGKVEPGARSGNDTMGLDSVETHRMPDAFDILESLVPELQSCVREIDRSAGVRALVVGARIAADGRTQCALAAASSGTLPESARRCSTALFEKTKFPPPKGGPGLVLVPIRINRK